MDEVRSLIRRGGAVPFSVFIEAALYGPDGFYTNGGGAGRRRDFLTSPEVGSLFGAVLSRALDQWWDEFGQPDPFFVAECGAGPGTLCRDVLRAAPRCAPALRYLLVDTAEPMRALHRSLAVPFVEPFELIGPTDIDADGDGRVRRNQGPLVSSLSVLPSEPLHVVFANELLDNLAFDVAQRDVNGWKEVRVGLAGERFTPTLVELDSARSSVLFVLAPDVAVGCSVPWQSAASDWVGSALGCVAAHRGRVVAIDYGASLAELGEREGQWLRTYRGHERGVDPFEFAGTCDITADIAVDLLARTHHPRSVSTQRDFLRTHGIDELAAAAKATWLARASTGDLASLAARSRVGEAEALLDPAGLGSFVVLEWRA